MKAKTTFRCIFFILFIGISFLSAQTEFSYRIINENVFTYNVISDDSDVNPENILQLSELDFVNRFFPVLSFTKSKIKLLAEPKIFLSPLDETSVYDLNELYVQYGLSEKLYITFGKKRINWGTANVWNPSNPFLQKDPFRIDNRLEGIVLTDIEYISSNFTLNVILSPEKKLNKSTFAIKATSGIEAFSYSMSYAFLGEEKQQFGVDFSLGGNNFTLYGEGILRNFSNINLIDSNGFPQAIATQSDFRNVNSEFVIGSMLNIFPRAILISEYRFRSDFNTAESIANFKNFLPNNLTLYDPISMGKHSFFSQISYLDSYSKYNINTSVFYDVI